MKTKWEYRVVKHTDKNEGFVHHDICEVYRNGDTFICTVVHKAPIGNTVDELRNDLKMMLEAFGLPVLEAKGDTLVEVEK